MAIHACAVPVLPGSETAPALPWCASLLPAPVAALLSAWKQFQPLQGDESRIRDGGSPGFLFPGQNPDKQFLFSAGNGRAVPLAADKCLQTLSDSVWRTL